jgi:hypothetical protein
VDRSCFIICGYPELENVLIHKTLALE